MEKFYNLFGVATMFLVINTASAGVITDFFDRTTFNGAVGGSLTVEDFTSSAHFPITTGVLNSSTNLPGIGITPGTIKAGVTYSTPVGTGNFFNIDSGGGYTGGFLDGFNPSDRDLTIVFDSAVAAFGFDTSGLSSGSGFDVIVQFLSGPDQTFTNVHPNSFSFFGWQSSVADIVSASVSNTSSFFGFDLDNFTFGGNTSSSVPEPTTLVLLSLGLFGLGFNRRKRI